MSNQVRDLLREARKLTAEEREQLADLLLESVDLDAMNLPDLDAAWAREADHRLAEHEASGGVCVDPFAAIEEARRQLRGAKKK